jgi:hypothetical protein
MTQKVASKSETPLYLFNSSRQRNGEMCVDTKSCFMINGKAAQYWPVKEEQEEKKKVN